MKHKKTVFISDFDGTITKEDFFHMVCKRLLKKDALKPWHDYQAGRITHIAAMDGIFAQIRLTRAQMDKFIATIPVDRAFYTVPGLCKKLKIPMYICSAGCDFYIKKRIGKYLKKYNIKLMTNKGFYSPAAGLRLKAPPKTSPFYSADLGVSKAALVQSLKKRGYFTIYAGDGKPDIEAARAADIVFARDMLLKLCKQQKIPAFELKTFKNIAGYIRLQKQ